MAYKSHDGVERKLGLLGWSSHCDTASCSCVALDEVPEHPWDEVSFPLGRDLLTPGARSPSPWGAVSFPWDMVFLLLGHGLLPPGAWSLYSWGVASFPLGRGLLPRGVVSLPLGGLHMSQVKQTGKH